MPNRLFDVITFDCYGTLIDWETGIAGAFLAAARGDGVILDRGAVLAAYAEVEPAVEAGGYRPYREGLAETAGEGGRGLGGERPGGAARPEGEVADLAALGAWLASAR